MKFRKLLVPILCVVLLLSLAGCGAASMEYSPNGGGADKYLADSPEFSYGYNGDSGLAEDFEKPTTQADLTANQKLVQKAWISAETEEMSSLLTNVTQQISALGGYVEAQEIQNGSTYSGNRHRSAYLTIRIPADRLNEFVEKVEEFSNVTSSKKTTDDITLNYVATESRMKALETEQARLLELLAVAETMEDLLTIEDRLTDVRTELEKVTSTLRVYDNQVNYATVYLNISEVKVLTEITEPPETVWERMADGFMNTVDFICNAFVELSVLFVSALPLLLMMGVFAGAVILIIWLIFRKRGR